MFSPEAQAKFLRVGTLVAFLVTVVVSIFFAYGYQFDTTSQQIVKKSVVLFDNDLSGFTLSVNGVPETLNANELRLIPGDYTVQLEAPAHHSWGRQIHLVSDQLMRMGGAWLIPTSLERMPDPRDSIETSSIPDFEKIMTGEHEWFGFVEVESGIRLWRWEFGANPSRSVLLKQPAKIENIKKVAFDAPSELLYILDTHNTLWTFADATTAPRLLPKRVNIRDLAQIRNDIFIVDATGQLILVAGTVETPFAPNLFAQPYQIESIVDVQYRSPWYVFAFTTKEPGKNNPIVPLVVMMNASGSVQFVDIGTTPLLNIDGTMNYEHGHELVTFDLRQEVYTKAPLPKDLETATHIRRLGETFWLLIITPQNHLTTCDQWFGQCLDLGMLGEAALSPSQSRFQWFSVRDKKAIIFDFDPDQKYSKSFRQIINTIIEQGDQALSNGISSPSVTPVK